jgi:hypothetical protein
MINKIRKYGKVELEPEILVDSQKNDLEFKNETKEKNVIWVEKVNEAIHSTTGSGGADLYEYRQRSRKERTEEWYENQELIKNQEIELITNNKERVNNILEKKREKNRLKRIKKKNVKKKWIEKNKEIKKTDIDLTEK